MPLNARFEGGVVILSNVGRSMNDPRYVDARQEVEELLDEGYREFVIELRGIGQPGPPLMGLLMTVTRRIQQRGGEVVLAAPSRGMEEFLAEMRMEGYWDVFRRVEEAAASFKRWSDEEKARSFEPPDHP